MNKTLKIFILLCGSLISMSTTRAEFIVFDFAGSLGSNTNGFDLDNFEMGMTLAAGSTITATMTAMADGIAGSDLFNRTASPNFGINASGGGDVTDAFDAGTGMSEFMTFSFSFTGGGGPPYSATFVSIDFDRITGSGMPREDAGALVFSGGGAYNFDGSIVDGSDLLTVGENFGAGQSITLSHVDGNGFGLEQITLDVIAVPEPSSVTLVSLAAVAGLLYRRRKAI